jgi:beta-glucosidase/6-phospho-beta-glucosidase/beta-galactosidase
LPEDAVFKIAHNVLKANGLATILMRQIAKQKIEIGQAFALTGAIPFSENDKDINAAKHCFFNHPDSSFWGTWFLDTITNGPMAIAEDLGWSELTLKIIKGL